MVTAAVLCVLSPIWPINLYEMFLIDVDALLIFSCPLSRSGIGFTLSRRPNHPPHVGCCWLQEASVKQEGEEQLGVNNNNSSTVATLVWVFLQMFRMIFQERMT